MKTIYTTLILILSTYVVAQTKIDTIANGIIVENDFSKQEKNKTIHLPSPGDDGFEYQTPFNKKSEYESWGVNAKVLPWYTPISIYGLCSSAGMEYGFFRNHSIGCDIYYNKYNYRGAELFDTTTKEYYIEPRMIYNDKAVMLHYKYYLNLNTLRKKTGMVMYVGCFGRIGKISSCINPEYNRYTPELQLTYKSIGIMTGVMQVIGYVPSIHKPIYLDVNLGVFYKEKVIYNEFPYSNNLIVTEPTATTTNFGIRLGVNISMNFSRKSLIKHKAKS